MGTEETGLKWWLRYVVIPVIGSGGVMALIVAFVNRPAPPGPPFNPNTVARPDAVPPSKVGQTASEAQLHSEKEVSPRKKAEQIALKFFSAFNKGDLDAVLPLTGEPFYWDRTILPTRLEVRSNYERWRNSLKSEDNMYFRESEIAKVEVQTIRELKDSYALTNDNKIVSLDELSRAVESLNLGSDDYTATFLTRHRGHEIGWKGILLVRRLGDAWAVVGLIG